MIKKYFLMLFFVMNFYSLQAAESLLNEVQEVENFDRCVGMMYEFCFRNIVELEILTQKDIFREQKNILQRMTELVSKEAKKRKTIEFEQWHSSCSRRLERHASSMNVILQWHLHEVNSEIKFTKEMEDMLRGRIQNQESDFREKIEKIAYEQNYFLNCIQDKENEQREALRSEEFLHRKMLLRCFRNQC